MRLRRADLRVEGIGRRRRGKGFVYHVNGGALTDPEVLARIRALVIPPAWQQVWICPDPAGHIQAVGVDAAGRKQYLYHEKWRAQRDAEKFDHMLDVARALPRLRRRVAVDLALEGMPKERALAAAARLLDSAALRIGGESYAQDDPVLGDATFGLATLRREHVRVRAGRIGFRFAGKGGVALEFDVDDPALAHVLKTLLRRRDPSPELLAFRDGGRRWRDVRSEHVNEYLRDRSGVAMSAKDFRTWYGTVAAAMSLAEAGTATGVTRQRRAVAQAMRDVAELLGNTPAIARKSYVDGRLLDLYARGDTIRPGLDRRQAERATIRLLTEA